MSTSQRLYLPSGLLTLGFSKQNFVWISHLYHASFMSCPSHPWFDHPNNTGETYKLWSSSLCSLLQPAATSCLMVQNIFLSTL